MRMIPRALPLLVALMAGPSPAWAATTPTPPVAPPPRPRIALGAVLAPEGQSDLAELATRELRRELAGGIGLDVVPLPAVPDSVAAALPAGDRIRAALGAARGAGAVYVAIAELVSARSLLLAPAIGRAAAENEARATLVVLRVADGCAVDDLVATEKRPSRSAESDRDRALADAVGRAARDLGCRARQALAISGRVYAMAGSSEAILLMDARDGLRKGARLRLVRPLVHLAAPRLGSAAPRADLEVGEMRISRIEPARCFARLRGHIQAHAGDRVYGIAGRNCERR